MRRSKRRSIREWGGGARGEGAREWGGAGGGARGGALENEEKEDEQE